MARRGATKKSRGRGGPNSRFIRAAAGLTTNSASGRSSGLSGPGSCGYLASSTAGNADNLGQHGGGYALGQSNGVPSSIGTSNYHGASTFGSPWPGHASMYQVHVSSNRVNTDNTGRSGASSGHGDNNGHANSGWSAKGGVGAGGIRGDGDDNGRSNSAGDTGGYGENNGHANSGVAGSFGGHEDDNYHANNGTHAVNQASAGNPGIGGVNSGHGDSNGRVNSADNADNHNGLAVSWCGKSSAVQN
mmetsp:Transcript_124361/g.247983  ORF Transcript_124361/g.247983 Transcript_124361/m.247983 type:complete len:246 (+) Transcript_124361:53-790(+)